MRPIGLLLLASLLASSGCGSGKPPATGAAAGSPAAASGNGEDAVSPEERPFLDAGRPFYDAIAARDHARAYALLSSHARARMSLNQFHPEDDDAAFKRNEESPRTNVDAAQFAELMKIVEKELGQPSAVIQLDVFSTDRAVLSRTSKEEGGALDSMFAIGAMPDSIPAAMRRASLRGQIRVALSAAALAETAKAMDVTVEALQKDEDFNPYLNLKVVLVEEGGSLRVAYFEFLPPGIMD